MPRKILVFFMSMVLLGGYGIGVYRAQADSDLDQYLVYALQGTVRVDNVALTPTANSEHTQYVLVPLVRKVSNGIAWTELTARKYQMGSDVDAGDDFLLLIQDDDEVDGVPIGQGGPNFEMKIQIYLLGDESTKYDVGINAPPPGESWYVGKGTSPGGIYAQADVYASIPPGQPQNLQAAATVGSEIRNINLQWTAPGADDGLGTVTGYLAKVSTAPITGEPEWNAATLLNTTWLTPPLAGPGQPESRTATVDPPAAALDPDLPHYVALRAVDAAGTQGPFASAQANMPPTATSVAIAPSVLPDAETTDNLVLTYSYSDAENDPESGTLIRWYKGGVQQPAYNNQNPLPSSATTKGETWKASVQPANAKGIGLEVESNELTIVNTPPEAVHGGPYSSKIDSGGTTVLPITFNGTGSSDADGDPLTYAWTFGDGTTDTGPTPTHTYPAILILYPNTFNVTLKVYDGEAYSSTVSTTATVTINKKPVADAGGPYEGIAGEPLTLDGSGSTDADDTVPDDLVFAWDFENDGTPDFTSPRGTPTATHTYPSHGTYTASLVVTDYLEDSAPDTASVLIRARPVADFTWLPDPQNEGLPVDFTDASTDADGTIVSWVWDFGDGFGDVGPNPSHTYTDNGAYTVELTVTDNDGLTDTEQHVVTVNNVAPDVEAGADQSANEGDTVSISGTFTDPGTSDTHIATINWGDGTPVDTVDPATSPVPGSHVYADNGVYTVTLTVTDDDGGIGEDTLTVTVSNVDPVVDAGADQAVNEGDTVSTSGTFTDPGSGDTHIGTINWGDGSPVDTVDPATSPVPGSHVYADNGLYIVELTVTDDDGGQGSDTLTVDVSNADPIVDAGADQSVNEGDVVSISGTFTDPGSGDTHTATIDWGDGSPVDTVDPATSPVPGSHVYVDEGDYTVTLTVTDDEAGVGTDTLIVTVSNAPPVVEAGPDQSVNEGDTVPISGTFTDPGSLDTHTATINWGDGSPVDNIDPATSPVPSTHVYADNGVYTVTLTVTDNDGGIGADTLTVTVSNVAPVVEAGADQSVNEGDTVSISGTFTDASSVDTHTATIDWGDGTPVDTVDPATSPVPGSHVYADNGVYTVTLTVTDDDGGQGSDTLEVTVSNVAPTADAGADQSVNEGDTVSFTGSFTDPGSGDTHTIEWDFGDSGASGTLTPTHVYADNGVYTVTLTVTDDDGGIGTDTLTVTVSNVAPTAEAGPDQSVNEGDTVAFAGSFSDPGSGDTHTIEWDFGDSNTDSGSLTPTHVYADDGVYTVTLTVTDDDGGIGTDTLTVTVSNVAPTAEAGADQSVNEGDTVSFAGSFTDPGSGDTHTIEWDFGDSGTDSGSLTPTHVYVDEGVYTVTLTVTDDDGGVGTDTLTVTVSNAPPVVDAGPDQSVDEGDTVSFSGSFDDPGSGDTHTIEWDFGDSGTDSGSLTPTHVYADNGVYTVTLTVTDNYGDAGTDTLTVTVSNVAPVVDAGPGDLEVSVRQPVNITVEFSDQGSGDTHTATVNWGDGTPVDNIDPAISPMSASHIYVVAGEFNVVITITDDDGGTVTHSMKITVIGIEVQKVTFNVLEPTLIVELDEPVEPDLTNFDLIGMEVSNSGNWDFQMSQQHGLPIMEQGPSKILHIDMKRDHINAQQLTIAGLVKFLPVDFLARFGAFGDAAGSQSIEVTGADDMRITMVANGFILGTLGDVSGNGQVTALDAALIARAAVQGTGVLPITTTTKQIDALLPGANIAKATADVNKDGNVNADDAFLGLRLAAGYDTETAPPNMASDTRKCRLSVNNYDSGKLDVSLDVEDVSGVYCADIVVSYDPGALTVAGVSRTSSISDWVFADVAESGKLRIAMAGLSQPAANGSLVDLSIHAASADAIKELQIIEFKLNGGRARAEVENLPKVFALMPNYPNPFNPETWIPYQITVPANVTVSIYNLNGQIVRRLELGTRMPGSYINRSKAAYWDGRNESGEMVSSGIYFYQLQAGRDAAVRKMVIVK